MNQLLSTVLLIGVSGTIALLCYVFLYREYILVIQRPFFFRLGLGAFLAAILSVSSLVFEQVPLHLSHAVLAVAVAAAVHAIQDGLSPENEGWFHSLFRP
ncbi:hypothetical protein [Halomarina litorea]|uniref:hypothetical protein n=1 Tax=Halomarina litorea TaxID=2961595 RepID=UPI0020C31244|nr:hypothetical protein [Halomarina sp. BCD28]